MDLIEDYFKVILVVTPIVAGIITWYFTSRHIDKKNLKLKDSEIENSGLDVILKKIKIYQDLLNDIEERCNSEMKKKNIEIQKLKDKLKEVYSDCLTWKNEIGDA